MDVSLPIAWKDKAQEDFFEEIINAREKIVFRVYSMIRNLHDAEDIYQRTFLRVMDTRDKYDKSKGKAEKWAMGIARNYARDYIKLKRIRDRKFVNSEDNVENAQDRREKGPLECAILDECFSKFREIAQGFSEQEKEILGLRFLQGYSLKKIGEIVGVSYLEAKERIEYLTNFLNEHRNYFRENYF